MAASFSGLSIFNLMNVRLSEGEHLSHPRNCLWRNGAPGFCMASHMGMYRRSLPVCKCSLHSHPVGLVADKAAATQGIEADWPPPIIGSRRLDFSPLSRDKTEEPVNVRGFSRWRSRNLHRSTRRLRLGKISGTPQNRRPSNCLMQLCIQTC